MAVTRRSSIAHWAESPDATVAGCTFTDAAHGGRLRLLPDHFAAQSRIAESQELNADEPSRQ
jgi:hypothetical protein